MAVVERYVDPDVVGGLADGTSWANAYSSLSDWEASEEEDLVSDSDQHFVHCRSSSGTDDETEFDISNWETNPTYYIKIIVDAADRHAGVWDDSKYVFKSRGNHGIDNDERAVRFEGVQFDHSGDFFAAIRCTYPSAPNPNDIRINDCIFRSVVDGSTGSRGVEVTNAVDSGTILIENCLFYDFGTDTNAVPLLHDDQGSSQMVVYNTTIIGGNIGVLSSGRSSGILCKNVLVKGTDSDCFDTEDSGTFDSDSDYNASDDTSDTDGTNDRTSQTFTFADEGSDDYALASTDTGALLQGLDLEGEGDVSWTDDIAGNTRIASNWDIGAFKGEYAPTPNPMTFSTVPVYVDSTSITMIASLASHIDSETLEYYFTNTAGGGNDSGWQSSRTYVDSGLSGNTQYTYTVKARGATTQHETAVSSAASAYTFPSTPANPSGLGLTTISNSRIDLAWSDNTDSFEETGFEIYRSTNGVDFALLDTTATDVTAYSDTGLDSNTQYWYRVRARIVGVLGTAYSDYTSDQNAFTLPDAPTLLTATEINSSRIDLDWTGEASFKIERSLTGSFGGEEVEIIGAGDALTVSAYSNTSLSEDTFYYYRVRAYNAAGNTAYATAAFAMTPPTDPVIPTSFGVTPINAGRIDLVWSDDSDSFQETGFEVYRSTDGLSFSLLVVTAADAEAYSDVTVASNTQYWYKVRAFVDSANDSAVTSYSSFTAALSGLTIPDVPASFAIAQTSDITLTLTWTGEASFKVERSLTGSFGGEETEVVSDSDDLTALLYLDTGLTENTLYYYRIRAYNATGNTAYTSTVSALTLLSAIQTLTATVIDWQQINLAWSDESDSGETFYYQVQRMLDGLGDETDPDDSAWTAFVDESDLLELFAYSDLTPVANTKYHYQVRAFDLVNYSNWKLTDATTDAEPVAPVADAGPDQTVAYVDRESVVLDGSDTTSDVVIASYIWRYNGLSIGTGVGPTVALEKGVNKITLAATNEFGTGYDSVNITVQSAPIDLINLIPKKFR